MKIFAILIIVTLIAFTGWQGYLTVKKIILKKKCKGAINTDSTQPNVDIENSKKEEK